MTEGTYKKARKALVKKGWIIHNQGEIIVDYDAIYKSEKDIEDTPSSDIENTPSESEGTPKGNIDNTHNNINTKIIPNNKNENNITVNYPKAQDNFTDENGNFKF